MEIVMIGQFRTCRPIKVICIAGTVLASGLSISQAYAKGAGAQAYTAPNTDNQADRGTDEIVVTAQFREQNLQRTPLAITALSSAILDARGQTSISAVADQAPSVTLKPQGATFGPSLVASIRGIGQLDFNPAVEPGVGIYVDDVYYATITGSIFDLLDTDRVEILRGPQGTLAGKNSIGGAIKAFSKKPTGSGRGYFSATYGSRDRLDLRGSADFKITDTLFARISGVAKQQDGYIDRVDFGCRNPGQGIPAQLPLSQGCVFDRQSDVNYQGGRGILRWVPGDKLEVNLIADYTRESRNTTGSVLRHANFTNPNGSQFPGVVFDNRFLCGKYCNYATFETAAGTFISGIPDGAGGVLLFPVEANRRSPRTEFKGYGFSGAIDYALSDRLNLKSITAYRAYSTSFANDDDYSPLQVALASGDIDFHSISQEMRLNGSLGSQDELEYTVGGLYLDHKSRYTALQDLRYAPIPLQFLSPEPVKANTRAAFLHVSYHVTDALTLTGGLRYTHESKDYFFHRTNTDGSFNPFQGPLDGRVGSYAGSRVDYRANVQYQWSPDVMTYAQVSTGFKGGGINPRPFVAEQVQPFKPETLETYEIGTKLDLFGRAVRLNAAAFYSRYNGVQLLLTSCPQFGGPGPCAMTTNAGNAHIKGFELETTARPVENLTFDGSLSYLDFNYTSINPAAGGPGGVQLGMISPYTPNWKWSGGAQYRFDLGSAGSITSRVDAAYQSHLFTQAVNSPFNRIPGYTVANARLTYRNDNEDWELSFEVTNLTDKYYLLTNFDLTGVGAGVASDQPGRPREWAVTVKKTF